MYIYISSEHFDVHSKFYISTSLIHLTKWIIRFKIYILSNMQTNNPAQILRFDLKIHIKKNIS